MMPSNSREIAIVEVQRRSPPVHVPSEHKSLFLIQIKNLFSRLGVHDPIPFKGQVDTRLMAFMPFAREYFDPGLRQLRCTPHLSSITSRLSV
eukprot:jgi/Botrbrau1/17025/Bobra.49_2s0081.1